MNKLTGRGLAAHAISKLGTPYVYGAKGINGIFTRVFLSALIFAYTMIFTNIYITKAQRLIGKVCTDCSGLISWYTRKNIGSYQMYSTASKRGLIKDINKAPIGAVLWKQGHVGVYIGNGYCIEAKGIDYGTVKTKISDTHFTHWLLFEDYIDYDDVIAETTKKQPNPYKLPKLTVIKGMAGEDVKWVQWELVESGFNLKITGICDILTDKAIREFQQSCKIKVDGKVGPDTRKSMIAA